jgi:hypothetical protein
MEMGIIAIIGLFVVTIEQCRINYRILKDIKELKEKA